MNKSLLYGLNSVFFDSILRYRGADFEKVGACHYKIAGFKEFNYLIDINHCFSTAPMGDIVDRTGQVAMPMNWHIDRPWCANRNPILDLDTCFESRVQELTSLGQKVNLLWSGGIDSTAMLAGFLKHCNDYSQIRVIHSVYSIKENPRVYLDLLENSKIEMIEFGGDIYMEQNYDGVFVSADVADDITASIDESFFAKVGYDGLQGSWKDFFRQRINDDRFIDFCEQYFSISTIPITTVLQARWWFYTKCKTQRWSNEKCRVLRDNQPLPVPFFDTDEFENYAYHNIDSMVTDHRYDSYKQPLKDYIYEFNRDDDYRRFKRKENSYQLQYFTKKLMALKSTEYIMLLRDGTRIRTPSLPLISQHEFEKTHGDSLEYLFNF